MYELRIYDVNPGKMKALQDRFRDHVIRLFTKHDMKITQFWIDINETKNRLYYVVEHDNMEMRNLNYERFSNDPQWLEVKRVSEVDNGILFHKQESIFMENAAFFEQIQ